MFNYAYETPQSKKIKFTPKKQSAKSGINDIHMETRMPLSQRDGFDYPLSLKSSPQGLKTSLISQNEDF